MAQLYYSPISINAAQVPSTQTDFPVLVSQTDNRFKTTGNGGHVANSNGFDIRPYSDTGLTAALTYELERYNASTGEVIMWVKVASLSSSTTPIYLGYGDTSLTTDGSSTATWSNSFIGVYHLKDGTTLSTVDSTGTNTPGNGQNSPTAATGQIDGGVGLAVASTQYVTLGTVMHPAALTLSAWVKATSFTNAYNGIIVRSNGSADFWQYYVKSNGKMYWGVSRSAGVATVLDGTGSHTLSTATWYYVAMTFSTGNGLIGYVNASSDASGAGGFTLQNNAVQVSIGTYAGSAASFAWDGVIDEARVASTDRSANWITTEYNNQVAPGTFETLGTEVAFSAGGTSNMFLLFP